MKLGKRESEDKVELQMTPMIDVVFQLLIFFLFSFKIVPVEGEIGVNMPPVTTGSAPRNDQIDVTERIRIRVLATPEGDIAAIVLGEANLGRDPSALTKRLREAFVGPAGKAEGLEVEIDAARKLHYSLVVRVTNAAMRAGIEKINFTEPPKAPSG